MSDPKTDSKAPARFLFFEQNSYFNRFPNKFRALLSKSLWLIPKALSFSFFNFAESFPSKAATVTPLPQSPPQQLRVGVDVPNPADFTHCLTPSLQGDQRDQWNIQRGLPFSDSTVARFAIGPVLLALPDLAFTLTEIHRVCEPDGLVEIQLPPTSLQLEFANPTQTRVVTPKTLAYFADPAHTNRLFDIVACKDDGASFTASLRARKPINTQTHPQRIDIGCGDKKREGFTGIDAFDIPGVDYVRNVEKYGLPFSDSTISHVHAYHFFEHIRDFVFVMNEIHRVCCHNAIITLSVPTVLGPWALADPTHVRFFNVHTFPNYFEKKGSGDSWYTGIIRGYEILDQHISTSLKVTLRVVKE